MTEEARQESPMRAVARVIESPDMRTKFVAALPPDMPVDRFTRVVMTAINMRPELLDADRTSLYTSCLRAAQDGLIPDGREGVLNVYKTKVKTAHGEQWIPKVQWMPMVEGVIKQLAKAGINAYAASVYQNDKVRIWNDDSGQHIEHEPVVFGDRGDMIGAYARGITPDGHVQIEAMNMDELNRARAASKNADGAVYQQWPDRMAQKTVLHRLRKRMAILDPSVAEALRRDEDDDLIGDDDPPVAETVGTPSGPKPAPVPPAARSRTLQAVVDHAAQPEPDAVPTDDSPPNAQPGTFSDW